MGTLEVIFFGIILFIGEDNQPRTVVIPDLSAGTEVHQHRVQEHMAAIRVKKGVAVPTNWTAIPVPDKDYELFALDGGTLSITGLVPEPFVAEQSHYCEIPHLKRECPTFGELRRQQDKESASLSLATGTLSGCRSKNGATTSIYRAATTGEVTITLTKNGPDPRSLRLPSTATIAVMNEPTAREIVANHFIAFYTLSGPGACCTNIPFPMRPTGCGETPCPDLAISTVACSNSNYP